MVDKIVTGRDLKLMRLKAGKTPEQVAGHLNLKSPKTCVNWEFDRSGPDVNQWLKILVFYGVNPYKFVKAALNRNATSVDINFDELGS